MKQIKLIWDGFLIGLGKIIPGVSGGMIAVSLGLYEPCIQAVAHFFSQWKKNISFLGLIGIGSLFAITMMSGVIQISLEYYYLPTMLLFIGLMLGGFSSLKKEVAGTDLKKYVFHLLFPFLLLMVVHFSTTHSFFVFDYTWKSYGILFLFGIIDAITMVVPGISGTAILMLLGGYSTILGAFSQLFSVSKSMSSLQIVIPFCLGILVGVLFTIRLVSYLLEKNSVAFYYLIISFFLSSLLLLLIQTLRYQYTATTILIGLFFFAVGYFISKLLECHHHL